MGIAISPSAEDEHHRMRMLHLQGCMAEWSERYAYWPPGGRLHEIGRHVRLTASRESSQRSGRDQQELLLIATRCGQLRLGRGVSAPWLMQRGTSALLPETDGVPLVICGEELRGAGEKAHKKRRSDGGAAPLTRCHLDPISIRSRNSLLTFNHTEQPASTTSTATSTTLTTPKPPPNPLQQSTWAAAATLGAPAPTAPALLALALAAYVSHHSLNLTCDVS